MDLLSATIKLVLGFFAFILFVYICITVAMSIYLGNLLPQLAEITFGLMFVIPIALLFVLYKRARKVF